MKKLFGKSTKSKDIDIQALEQTESQTSRKSKRKTLRGFAFGGVALMMATAGVFAFAPLGTVQPTSLATSQPTDVLVTPKEDDPVLFTTEDGLEIKWGNAASLQGGGKETWSGSFTTYDSAKAQYSATPAHTYTNNLTSGNLSGFPYFTTTSGSTTYTWVIIGRNSNVTNNALYTALNKSNVSGNPSSAKIEYKTLNDWKAKIGNSDTYDNFVAGYSPTYKSFFNNTYETTSPAGAAINNNGLLSAVTARNYSASMSYTFTTYQNVSSVKTSTEIPSGCVLVLANGNVATGVYNTGYYHFRSTYFAASYGIYSGTTLNSNLRVAMNGYYTNGSFGLSAIKSRIQSVSLTTTCYGAYTSSSWGSMTTTDTAYVFPLGAAGSFIWSTYLTAAQMKLSANQWLRGGPTSGGYTGSSPYYLSCYYVNTSGANATSYVNSSAGYRPAFCLKVT